MFIYLFQGFPDFLAPDNVKEAFTKAINSDNPFMNQYTRAYVSTMDVLCGYGCVMQHIII